MGNDIGNNNDHIDTNEVSDKIFGTGKDFVKEASTISSISKYSTRLVTNDVVNSRYIPQSDISTAINSNLKEKRKIEKKNDQSKKEKELNRFNHLNKAFGNFDNNDNPDR